MEVDSINKLFEIFGVEPETFLMISGIVYFIVETLKGKFPQVIKTWRTDIVALLLACGLGYQAIQPKSADGFVSLFVLTLATWLIPAGVHKKLKGNKK